MIFRKATGWGLGITGFVLVCVCVYFSYSTRFDYRFYETLLQRIHPPREVMAGEQTREKIHKAFWLIQDGERKYNTVQYTHGQLLVDELHGSTRLRELMEHVSGTLPGEGTFTADRALVDTMARTVAAENVEIIRGEEIWKAGKTFYHDAQLDCSGDVSVKAPEGSAIADEGTILFNSAWDPTSIDLHQHVEIHLQDVGTMTCDQAQLDPLIGSGRAEGHVVCIHPDFTATGDLAILKMEGKQHELALMSVDEPCFVVSSRGDRVQAASILLKQPERSLLFRDPEGILGDKDPMTVKADEAIWEAPIEVLHLKGDILISQVGIGDGHIKGRVMVDRRDGELRSVRANGKIDLDYLGDAEEHHLKTTGHLFVDHEGHWLEIRAQPGSVVYFEDLMGTIEASIVRVFYALVEEDHFEPSTVRLEGQVKMTGSQIRQYALADQVEVDLKARDMVLKAQAPKRVLLYDETNQLTVSAPALKIRRDEVTQKEAVQGMGDVRFQFAEHEFDQIRNRFNIK